MHRGTLIFLALSLVLGTAALLYALPAAAATFEEGRVAANRGEFGTAFRIWKPLAETGNADAQHGLGRMYARGDGVKQSYREAQQWFTLAASRGHALALRKLGIMYQFGDGVRQDSREAARYFALAARAGDQESKKRLAALQKKGVAPPRLLVLPASPAPMHDPQLPEGQEQTSLASDDIRNLEELLKEKRALLGE